MIVEQETLGTECDLVNDAVKRAFSGTAGCYLKPRAAEASCSGVSASTTDSGLQLNQIIQRIPSQPLLNTYTFCFVGS